MPPTGHALLSASSAHRWLVCTAAPRFEAQFEGTTSEYAEEGTLAHEFCELFGRRAFDGLPTRQYNARLKALKKNSRFNEEMLTTAQLYVDYLKEKAHAFGDMPHVSFEVRVNLSEYIPDGFGTCDNAMVGGDLLRITDYKHGKGVVVNAEGNAQMRLYALGALRRYQMIYGDSIKRVAMGIFQPRVTDEPSETEMTVEELLAWGESIKPIARKAYDGNGDFVAGDHCKFCRGKSVCRERNRSMLACEEFASCVNPAAVPAGEPTDASARAVLGLPPILSNAEIADALKRGANLAAWYEDLKDYAVKAMLDGEEIPGFKVVEGKSNRVWIDADAMPEIFCKAGLSDEMIYKPKEPRTLTEMEKVLGKKRFADEFGQFVTKPAGKPALAMATDKRPAYNSAVRDFAGVTSE